MCVAVIVDSKAPIPAKNLQAMHEANPHGAGIAWQSKGIIQFRKGLTWQQINEVQDRLPRPFFMHYRIATQGGRIPELTHPFPLGEQSLLAELSGSAPAVLMHNGTWQNFRQWIRDDQKEGTVSDTQIAAWVAGYYEDVLAEVSWSNAILRAVKGAEPQITLRGRWMEFEGNQYSNEHWKRELTPKFYYSHNNRGNFYDWETPTPPPKPALSHQKPKTLQLEGRKKGSSAYDTARAKYESSKKKTTDEKVNEQAWGKDELFTKDALKAEQAKLGSKSVPCEDCGVEITQIPCQCTGAGLPDAPPIPQCEECMSCDTSHVRGALWMCESCYHMWEETDPGLVDEAPMGLGLDSFDDYATEDLTLSGDQPGDGRLVDDYIRMQGIKIVPDAS